MLKLKGYRILARRFKSSVGEVDLIVSKGSMFVFVEVKARKTVNEAFESITEKQKSRIEAAANHWLQQQSSQEFACRFDVNCGCARQASVPYEGRMAAWLVKLREPV